MKTRAANSQMGPPHRTSDSHGHRRKRSDSDASASVDDIPERMQTSQTPSTRPTRSSRRKRSTREPVNEQADEETFPDELHDNINLDPSPTPLDSAIAMSEDIRKAKKARYSYAGPPTKANDNNLYPDLHAASSPLVNVTSRRSDGRQSLPAHLPRNTTPFNEVVQFIPLAEAIDKRTVRRIRRNHLSEEINSIEQHKRVDLRRDQELSKLRHTVEEKDQMCKELQLELEERRLGGIELDEGDEEKDRQLKAMEEELTALRARIASHENMEDDSTQVGTQDGIYFDLTDENYDDNDDLEMIEPGDIGIAEEDITPDTSFQATPVRPLSPAETAILDPAYEDQVQSFETAIKELTKKASNAQGALEIIRIELQSIGFTDGNTAPEDVLSAIRTAFRQARQEVMEILPEQVESVEDAKNGAFLQLLVNNIRGLVNQVHEQLTVLNENSLLIAHVNAQNKGLIDTLADATARNNKLQVVTEKLDVEIDQRTKDNTKLEDEVETWTTLANKYEGQIGGQQDRIAELEEKGNGDDETIARLTSTLQKTRDDLREIEGLVLRLQDEHKEAFTGLQQEKNDAEQFYEAELENERNAMDGLQADLQSKQTMIDHLEHRVEEMTDQIDGLREQLLASQDYGLAERNQREETESHLTERNKFIETLEAKIADMEKAYSDLQTALDQLRQRLDTEIQQRENTEAALELQNQRVDELNDRLHDAGKEANNLRMMLFAEQQALEKVKADMTKREEKFQNDIALEIFRRAEAERAIAARDATIAELKDKTDVLDEVKEDLAEKEDLLQQREERLFTLNEQIRQSKERYNILQDNSQIEIDRLRDEIGSLQYSLGTAENRAAALEKELQDMSQARQDENEDKSAEIARLRESLGQAQDEIRKLGEVEAGLKEHQTSLERRIESQAMGLLEYQVTAMDEATALNDQIQQQKAKYRDLQRASDEREKALQLDITQLNTVIAGQTTTVAAMDEEIGDLKSKMVRLKDIFHATTEEGIAAQRRVSQVLAAALGNASEKHEEFEKRIDSDTIEVDGIVNGVLGEGPQRPATKAVKRTRRSRRDRDSGIQVESESHA